MQAARRIFRPTNDQAVEQVAELVELQQHVKDFLRALDRGYFPWDGKSAFVDALRDAVSA